MSDQKKQDGGPAFPIYGKLNEWGYAEQPGMTLRDYFAAKVMQGMMAHWWIGFIGALFSNRIFAEDAYKMADAMLKAREQ